MIKNEKNKKTKPHEVNYPTNEFNLLKKYDDF